MTQHTIPRRKFLAASISALGLAPMPWLRAQPTSPNDEITIGVIGHGAMGSGNMINFLNMPGVRVVAVCDPDSNRLNEAKAKADQKYANSDCKAYAQYTDLLQHPGLDAISLATPDHWHAKIGIDAANAGLDIYGEKPFTWGLAEGRMLVDALKRNKRVWQTGSWQRSSGEFRRFHALIQNNTLGKLTRYECGTPSGMGIQKHVPEDQIAGLMGKPPAHLDWKTWCGPAGEFTYHPSHSSSITCPSPSQSVRAVVPWRGRWRGSRKRPSPHWPPPDAP